MEHHPTIESNEVPICTTTRMKPDNIILNERSQHKRPHTVWIPSYEISTVGKSIETVSRAVVLETRGRENGE